MHFLGRKAIQLLRIFNSFYYVTSSADKISTFTLFVVGLDHIGSKD